MKKKNENPPAQSDGDGYRAPKHIGMKLAKHEFDQIDEHVNLLNRFQTNEPLHNREWVSDAIKEKLARESEFKLRDIPEEKNLSLYLDPQTYEQLEERINQIKKAIGGYTKKQWILAAVVEKLNREASEAKDKFQKLKTQSK